MNGEMCFQAYLSNLKSMIKYISMALTKRRVLRGRSFNKDYFGETG
jgi:hypothetical protein